MSRRPYLSFLVHYGRSCRDCSECICSWRILGISGSSQDSLWVTLVCGRHDTMILCNESWNNLWSLKALLSGFELASGLCVNLKKSKSYDIHLSQDFLKAVSTFLAYKIGYVPFFSVLEGEWCCWMRRFQSIFSHSLKRLRL